MQDRGLIERFTSIRRWRAWEDAHLPVYGSLLGHDLVLLLAQYVFEGRSYSLKEIYCSLPYSENAIRIHLRRLIREGWVALGCAGHDRRFRSVIPSQKLRHALESFSAARPEAVAR